MNHPTTARAQMPLADQLVDALRTHVADSAEVIHGLARWLGVNTADAEAFGEILYAQDRGEPLSPSTLSHRLGLGSGATAMLLNRLENAGLVVRSREHRDRRIVTLRIAPEVKDQAIEFFAPLADRVDAMMKGHPDQFLHAVVALLDELHAAVTGVIDGFGRMPPRSESLPE